MVKKTMKNLFKELEKRAMKGSFFISYSSGRYYVKLNIPKDLLWTVFEADGKKWFADASSLTVYSAEGSLEEAIKKVL